MYRRGCIHTGTECQAPTLNPTSPPSRSRQDGKPQLDKPQEGENVQPYFRRQRIQQHPNLVFLRFVVLRSDARAKKHDEVNKVERLHVRCTKRGAIKLDEEKWDQVQQPRHIPELDGVVEAPAGKDGRMRRVDRGAGQTAATGVTCLQGFDALHCCCCGGGGGGGACR